MGCANSKSFRSSNGRDVSQAQRSQLLEEFKEISQELEVKAMMVRTISAITNVLPVERASVFLVDRAGGVMRTFNRIDTVSSASSSTRLLTAKHDKQRATTVAIPLESGVAGAVVASCKSEIVADAQADNRFNRSVDQRTGFVTRNILSVPVILTHHHTSLAGAAGDGPSEDRQTRTSPSDGGTSSSDGGGSGGKSIKSRECVAVLQALNHEAGFREVDVTILEFLASLLSGVLARSALVDAATREKQRANALLTCADSVLSSEHCRIKAAHVLSAVRQGLHCERASLQLVDELRGQHVNVSHKLGGYTDRAPISDGVAGAVILQAHRVHLPDARADPRYDESVDGREGVVKDVLAVPVIRMGSSPPQVMGVLQAINSGADGLSTGFDSSEQRLLTNMALQVADRLLPELIQDMVEASSDDHGMAAEEVQRVKMLLNAEFAAQPLAKQRWMRSRNRIHSILELGTKSRTVVAATSTSNETAEKSSLSSASVREIESWTGLEADLEQGSSSSSFTKDGNSLLGMLFGESSTDTRSLPTLRSSRLRTLPRTKTAEEILSWDLDILTLDSNECMQVAAAVFFESGVMAEFRISPETLGCYLAAVGGRYHANPYHNFNHGVHVLLASWLLVYDQLTADDESMRLATARAPTKALTPLQVLSLLTAAVAHDVDHPGVTNAFLIRSGAPLALRYNDISVLENHHAATTFAILSSRRSNMLGTLTPAQAKEARGFMISAILATDMAHHSNMVKELTQAASEHKQDLPPTFTLQVLCHTADLCNCAIKWDLSREWAVRVCDEATSLAQREASLEWSVEKTTPYSEMELVSRQLIFLDGWIVPLFKAAALLFPGARARLNTVERNREACKAILLEGERTRESFRTSGVEPAPAPAGSAVLRAAGPPAPAETSA